MPSSAEARVLAAIDEQALIETVVDLVRVPSVSGTDAESQLQHIMADALTQADCDVDLWPLDLQELLADTRFPGMAAPAGVIVILAVLLDSARAGRYRCGGEGAVDQDGRDGGGGGEGFGVEDSAAGRGAVQQKRQLLAELFGVGGAGLAGGLREPGGEGSLVVAGLYAGRVARVGDLDGRRDERAQGRVHVERGQETFAGGEVGAVEHFGEDVGVESAQAFGDQLVFAAEVLVERAFGHLGHRAELVHAGAVDALIAKQSL
jgi:hypothetical protein